MRPRPRGHGLVTGRVDAHATTRPARKAAVRAHLARLIPSRTPRRERFEEEGRRAYGCELRGADLEAFARLITRLWQVHPFVEGNTRAVAVFSELYLAHLGFSVGNDPFERHARYFRDALVRANYRNAPAGVLPDLAPLAGFYDSLLNGAPADFSSDGLRCQPLFDEPSLLRNVDPALAIKA